MDNGDEALRPGNGSSDARPDPADVTVWLDLPRDLTKAEAEKIARVVMAYAVEPA